MEKSRSFDREKHLETLRKERLPKLKEILCPTGTQKPTESKIFLSEIAATLPFLWVSGFFAGIAAMLATR